MDDLESDADLDALLARSGPTPPAAATRTAALLAREISKPRGLVAWRRNRKIRIAVAVVGALVLAGAGTVSAYELSIPPFQSIPPGVVRIQPGIPVNYTNSLGRRVECLLFLEVSNIDDDDFARLAALAGSPSWIGFGDRTLKELGIPDASPEAQNHALSDAVTKEMWRQARIAVPELTFERDTGGPFISGSAMSCTGPGGVDGKP